MHTIEVSHIAKSFGETRAVEDVLFTVGRGEIFGLLGPNGAGKTTTIRIILDIFKPDGGSVALWGGPMTEAKKDRVGYMPEERGLYQDAPLERCLLYLAGLKGLSQTEARRRLADYLERFDLAPHKHKKVKELSKGMQQKAQIINTILHAPELIIVDEPFAALDPMNTQMIMDMLRDLRQQGATIIMSTHQMHHAEELCDRILLINQGRNLLYGNLEEIRRRYVGDAVLVSAVGELPHLTGVEAMTVVNHVTKLTLGNDSTPQDVLKALVERGVVLEKFEIAVPSLNEIFIRAVSEEVPDA
ncbi:MAG TPA: ATP-binding cassette domain-containing protein [Anaerolineae bacterium]|nr:ATP-binding cassette domain-containing protein [Anaerolineae bacterium]